MRSDLGLRKLLTWLRLPVLQVVIASVFVIGSSSLGLGFQPIQIVSRALLALTYLLLLIQLRTVLQQDEKDDVWLWRTLVVTAALWTLANLYEVGSLLIFGGAISVPSFSHLLLLAGLLAATSGLGLYPVSEEEQIGRLRDLLDVVILLLGSVFLFWISIVQPAVESGVGNAISIVWLAVAPAFGLTLSLLCFRLILLARRRAERIVLVLLLLAFLVRVPSDFLQAYMQLLPGQVPMALAELGWFLSPIAMTIAAVVRWHEDELSPRFEPSAGRWEIATRLEGLLPPMMTYLVGGFALVEWWLVGQPGWVSLGATGVLLLLLVGRQGVIAGQREMRQHAALVRAAADLAFVSDSDGRLVLVNPALEDATDLGQGKDEMGSLQDLMPAEMVQAALEQAQAGGWSGEVMFQGSGGHFPVALSLRPLVDARQTELLIAGTAHDLSELKAREAELEGALAEVAQAREQLQALNASLEGKVKSRTVELAETIDRLEKMNEELQELDTLKSEFVTLVSHELRGPLTNIRSGVELALRRAGRVPGSIEETLQLVSSETERLTNFVEIILDLSALDAGRFPMDIESTPLPVTVRTVASRIPANSGGNRIVLDLDESLPAVEADERSLMSVLFHLLDNALKYAPEGPVTVSAQVDQESLRVSVADTGPGIAPGAREAVFDQFRRLDASDSRDVYGHGLGLYLSRRLVEAMGGRIEAQESATGGAQIVFWLPLSES